MDYQNGQMFVPQLPIDVLATQEIEQRAVIQFPDWLADARIVMTMIAVDEV